MKFILPLCFCLFVFAMISCKCTEASTKVESSKLDAASKIELAHAEETAPASKLSLVILLDKNFDEATAEALKKIDVKLITKAGRIVTAEAAAASIRELMALPQVISIEINKTKSTK